MTENENQELAKAWISFQKNWWAWDKLDELCRKDAAGAWGVLQALVELAESDDLLEDIGVGPVEDFVNYYASDYIDEIERAAGTSDAMKKALSFSQIRDASDPMVARLSALGCKANVDVDEDPE